MWNHKWTGALVVAALFALQSTVSNAQTMIGQANLRFLDQSTLNVGPTSVIKLDKFVYDPNKKDSGTIALEATRGAFRFVTGSQNKGEVRIKTPYATLGVRG